MLRKLRLGQKLILFLCIVLLSTYTILDVIVLKTSYNYNHEQAKTIALLTSKDNAEKIVLNFEKIETIGISVANQMETMVQENSPSRQIVISTMKNTLKSNKDIFGIAVAYVPNEFDGKDKDYIGKEGDNSKGQFMPYVTRKGENNFSTELSFNPIYSERQNKWYNVPKDTHKTYLTEPISYPVQGKNVTMVSIVVPIMRNDKFVGVVSIDTTIDYLQTEIENVKPMGGFSQIISQDGTFVANGEDSKKVLTDISKDKEWIPILKKTSKGEGFTDLSFSSVGNEKVLRVFSSINVQGTDEYWTYVSLIPLSDVFAEFNSSFKLMVIVGVVLYAFIIYVNYSIIIKDI